MLLHEIIETIEKEEGLLYEDIVPYTKSLPFYLEQYDMINSFVAFQNDSYGMSWIITTYERLLEMLVELDWYSWEEIENEEHLDYVVDIYYFDRCK